MKKLVFVALLSLAALGFNSHFASAGWFSCHKCGKLGACATQYNAFSPYCVTGVYTSSHCHKCMHPAEGPCCNNQGWGLDLGGCGFGCGNTICTGPASMAGGDAATLGVLPAPIVAGTAQNGQFVVPQAPAPIPAVPGAASPPLMPARGLQPLGYQPTMPAPSAPAYWNN